MNRNGKPSIDDILALHVKLVTHYGPVRTLWERDEKFNELDFKGELGLPSQFADMAVILPTARGFVDTFVDHIDINNARVFANKQGIYKRSEDEMENARRLGQGILHMTNLNTDISEWRVSGKHYALHGLTAIGTFWDADMWPDKPLPKDGEDPLGPIYGERVDIWREETHLSLPIVLKAIHPHNLLPDPSTPRQFIMEESTMLRIDAEKLYPWWKVPADKNIDDDVVKIDYWDKDWHCVLVNREPILRVRGGVDHHRYGFIPYVLIESGLGNRSYLNQPEMRYVGILRYIEDVLVSESRKYSMDDIIIAKTAWAGGYLETPVGYDGPVVKTIVQPGLGQYQQLPPGVKVVTPDGNVPSQALGESLARTSYILRAHASPSSLSGLGEEGVRSGADRRLVISQGMAKFKYASDEAYPAGAARVLVNCARLAKNVIPGNLTVWYKTPRDEFDVYTIDKDMLKEPFNFTVEFAPVSEDDEFKRNINRGQLVAAGIVTQKWARQQMSNVDAKAIEIDIEKDKIRNDPGYQQIKSMYIQSVAIREVQKRIAADQVKEGGIPPPPIGGGPIGGPPIGIPPSAPLETGGRLIPPVREIAQAGSMQDIQNQMMPPPDMQITRGRQGMGGGGNTP